MLVPLKPRTVNFPNGQEIRKVTCGNSFTLALSSSGQVYSWGLGSSGGLGLGERNIVWEPTLIERSKKGQDFSNIKDISAGSNHCLALEASGVLYSWGNGQGGRLGHGDETGENVPKEIVSLRDAQIKIIEAGEAHSACINSDNQLLVWGVGLHGRLGNGNTSNQLKPMRVEDLSDIKIEDVVLGSTHSMCLLRNGKVMVWGAGKFGKLGLEGIAERNFSQPKELTTIDNNKAYQMAAGAFHTMVLTEQGELYSWGNSKDGKLGYENIGGS